MDALSNDLPAECRVITLDAIAKNSDCTPRTARKSLEKAGVRVFNVTPRRAVVRYGDYVRLLEGTKA